MAKKLTSVESTWSSAVLHDIFEAGGLIKKPVRTYLSNMVITYHEEDAARVICQEVKQREFNFIEVDRCIKSLSAYILWRPLHTGGSKKLTENQIAHIIAAFCAEKEIFWDDVNTLKSTVEMETFAKTTLGKACLDFGCFLSQRMKTTTKAGVSGGAPKSGYKSSGPKSGVIKGLVGKPGEKIMSSDYFYVIVADSAKKKTQFVFTDPLSPIAEVNKVRIGDPSGWSSCKLLFKTRPEAEEAIAMIERGDIRVPSDITGFTIKKSKPDANGYFKINTELGEVLIKASKLNEDAIKAITEGKSATKAPTKKSRFPEIMDIDVYTEAMYRYE
jgi:hypothetical protein